MAAGLTGKTKKTGPANRLCARCRRKCKQPEFAVISTCPRYYPIRTKQQAVKEWKQQELFPVDAPKKKTRPATD